MAIYRDDSIAAQLPFDQYGRYRMVQEALDAARPVIGERLRLLDVGGFFRTRRGVAVLPARVFLPHDDITVIDQQSAGVELEGYVQGDGRTLEFADKAFDFVLSCDTLEHVPAADRPAFWGELLRVARRGVLLAAPFSSPEVVAAEALLFRYIKAELGVEQLQLKEHAGYGLPALSTTCALLDERGLLYKVYPSGYVHAWLVMMLTKHYLLARTDDNDLHEQVDAYYTQFFAASERCEPAYRHCIIAACDTHNEWLALVDAALAPTIQHTTPKPPPGWPDLATWLLQLISMGLNERQLQPHIQPLMHTITTQAQAIEALHHALTQRDAQVRDLEARAHWLEEQATAAHRSLHAVEQGRVLRLLRWLQALRKR